MRSHVVLIIDNLQHWFDSGIRRSGLIWCAMVLFDTKSSISKVPIEVLDSASSHSCCRPRGVTFTLSARVLLKELVLVGF